uniref:Cytochrome B n=1 Tax=Candidatus Caldatribacterium californiense TaxID=1454726 RepID=A0A7V3YM49_9BACT
MKVPKVAFFDFTCCEGCQLQVTNLGEELLELLKFLDLVEFRETMSERWDGIYDIAVIEGSITTPHDVERIRRIRQRSRTLIAYGSCATIGGVNGMKNAFDLEEILQYVYGEGARFFTTLPTRPVHEVVPVEYFVHGCPVYQPEFLEVLKCALLGIPYHVPDVAVCVECKFNENVCFYERGLTCLGPITRAGCNSWCINNGNICYGCRGMVSNPNERGFLEVLERYGVRVEFLVRRMDMYNACRILKGAGKRHGEEHTR